MGNGAGRPSKMDAVQEYHCKDGQSLQDLLIALHIGQNKSLSEIADFLYVPEDKDKGRDEIKISKATVYNWMEFFNIPSRVDCPPAVVQTIENTVVDKDKQNVKKAVTNFDPNIEGFKCSSQCPHYDICKFQVEFEGHICPVSQNKKSRFIKPIKAIINERYKEDEFLLEHYTNLAELAGTTWEILNRKMSYIQSEDVTQILNRPDPVTGELKQVKVSNLLNGEIQKDQGTLIKLLELLKLTPKTADDTENSEDLYSKLINAIDDAKHQRKEKQSHIDEEQQAKDSRKEIKTKDDFENVMKELSNRHGKKEIPEIPKEDIENAQSIEDMMGGHS